MGSTTRRMVTFQGAAFVVLLSIAGTSLGQCGVGCESDLGPQQGLCPTTNCGSFLQGLIKPSDQCFQDFISPMSNFIFFEDPRHLNRSQGCLHESSVARPGRIPRATRR